MIKKTSIIGLIVLFILAIIVIAANFSPTLFQGMMKITGSSAPAQSDASTSHKELYGAQKNSEITPHIPPKQLNPGHDPQILDPGGW